MARGVVAVPVAFSLLRRPPRANLLLFLRASRCYGFWQEVLGCYVVNAGEGETGKKQCMPALEDYYECLHHRKEVRLCSLPPEFEGE